MTENYPPYNFIADARLQGIFIDVLMEVSKRMGSTLQRRDIQLVPWARAYRCVLHNPKTCLFGMARIPERENLFKWAGPVTKSRSVLIAKKGRGINANTLDDVRDLKIGTIKDDVHEKILITQGLGRESLVYSFGDAAALEIVKELDNGIIDLWAYGEDGAWWILNKMLSKSTGYKIVYVLQDTQGYFAFSRDISDTLIRNFQNRLDNMKADGTFTRIISTYLPEKFDIK